jgi:hypothetical protein
MSAEAIGSDMPAAQALALHYRQLGMPADGGASAACWSPLQRHLPWLLLPNFAWRRRALPLHDLHHLLLAFPWTPGGEFRMAAWEFAAGRFRHPCATAFCLPLLGLGALLCPQRSFEAFMLGRRSRSLYAVGLTPEVLGTSVADLRSRLLPAHPPVPVASDGLAYAGWVLAAWCWILLPVLLAAAISAAIWR